MTRILTFARWALDRWRIAVGVVVVFALGALSTEAAKEFIASMPTVEALMPTLDVGELEAGS